MRADTAAFADPDYLQLHAWGRPEADVWRETLSWLRLGEDEADWIARRAVAHGTSPASELIASGLVAGDDLFRAMAATLDIEFVSAIDPERLIFREHSPQIVLRRPCGPQIVRYEDEGGRSLIVLAPDRADLERLARYLDRSPRLRERLRFTTPSALRNAVVARAEEALSKQAANELFDRFETFSARTVLNAWQGAVAGAFAVAFPISLYVWPATALIATHLVSSVFFLACVALRIAASVRAKPPRAERIAAFDPADMPRYCILVALYHEAPIVPDLLVALSRIVWPRSKLEIKLVCEADDRATIDALRAQPLRPWIEILEVPPGLPRTKPKALAFALPATSADFVVLFDAEDKPHPLQLVEAWQRFEAGDETLACLQAPLVITNPAAGPIQRLFGFEYAALFRGLLPFLARRQVTLPLGGTSNHFRREALEAVGGWDPFNVTEDADLGVRLRRFGFRAEMLGNPTYEDAPANFAEWFPQRTRWLKGWTQTWLVHMRDPAALYAEIGLQSFLLFQVLFAGMIVSALVHPLFLLTMLCAFGLSVTGVPLSRTQEILLVIDSINIVVGYGAFLFLGARVLTPAERRGYWKVVAFTPVYWTMISAAGWRALWQLYRNPHRWEKTPHIPPRLRALKRRPPA